MPAGATALIGLLNPVVGTALGVVVAKEVFGWSQALGMFLVLGGVLAGQPAVVQWWRRASGRRSLDAREASRELGSGPGEALPLARRQLDELPRA
jgi:probable blue pigment (indigoidine) exporter